MKLNKTLGVLIVATAAVGAGAAAAAATTTAATTTATTAAATPAPGGMHWKHRHGGLLVGGLLRATRNLNLTEQQETQIKGILSAARGQRQAEAGTNAIDMTVLANPGDPNYATALQTAKSRLEARIQSQAELQSQIYNVLTAEQKAKLPSVLATMKAQAEQRRAAWQAQHPAAGTGAAGSN